VRNDFSINHRRVNVILYGAKAMLIGEKAGLARSGAACDRRHSTACRSSAARGHADVWLAFRADRY
jgi:hypothetical protein